MVTVWKLHSSDTYDFSACTGERCNKLFVFHVRNQCTHKTCSTLQALSLLSCLSDWNQYWKGILKLKYNDFSKIHRQIPHCNASHTLRALYKVTHSDVRRSSPDIRRSFTVCDELLTLKRINLCQKQNESLHAKSCQPNVAVSKQGRQNSMLEKRFCDTSIMPANK